MAATAPAAPPPSECLWRHVRSGGRRSRGRCPIATIFGFVILCGIAYGAFVLLASLAGGSSHTCADRDSCAAPVVAEQETPDSTVVRETALALTGDTGVSAYCPEYRDKIGGE